MELQDIEQENDRRACQRRRAIINPKMTKCRATTLSPLTVNSPENPSDAFLITCSNRTMTKQN